jgi:hypothetical protein
MISRLIASFMGASVIGHGLMLLLSIAKWRDLLNSQPPVYVGDKQTAPDLLNLLPEGIDLDPDVWLTRHKSILAFPCRNADRRSFGSKKILLEEFRDIYQIQQIRISYHLPPTYFLYIDPGTRTKIHLPKHTRLRRKLHDTRAPFIHYSFLHFKSD